MQDAVDCPEWVVPFHLFKLLAEEVCSYSIAKSAVMTCAFLTHLQQVDFKKKWKFVPPFFLYHLSVFYIFAAQTDADGMTKKLVIFLQYDLELVLMKNFHEFVHEYLQKPEFGDLMRRLGALGDGRQGQSNYSLRTQIHAVQI